MITIDEFMTPNPYTLRPQASLEDARKLMTEKNIRHIPVTDEARQLVGLVTQRDVLLATGAGARTENPVLADIMIKDVASIRETGSARDAALYLQKHKYGCLPVVADKRVVGIITDSDFIGIAINLLEQIELTEEPVDFGEDMIDDLDMPDLGEDF